MENVITIIKSTKSFQKSNNLMAIQPDMLGPFKNAIELKTVGGSYAEWLNSTCAGKLTKEIVKEIFEA